MKNQVLNLCAKIATPIIAVSLLIALPLVCVAAEADSLNNMEEQKANSRKSIEWWNGKFDVNPDSLFAKDYVNHQEPIAASDGEKGVSLDELKDIVASYHKSFPETKVDIQLQIAENNRVATHWTFTAVQKGMYEGLAATNKTVSWSGISIDEYNADGKISETWVVWDKFTMFKILGLIPSSKQ
ncbi:MAG: ester cyclase [Pseudomonadota bacterium]